MIDYEEDWAVQPLFHIKGSVALRSGVYAVFAAINAVLMLYLDDWFPGLREDLGLADVGDSTMWNATVGIIVLLCNFRQQQGLSRFWEGTGLLHQMRGEWFDTVSNCITFSIAARPKKPKEVMEFRHTLVRLMSLAHGSALEEIADNSIMLPSIDTYGLDAGTLRHLQECQDEYGFNKVEVMLHLVQSLITKAHYDNVVTVAPPILSRVYQTISRGFVNLLNAKKIADTRFPFPYVQLMTFLLLLHCFLTPMIITAVVKSKVLAAIFTFIPIFGLYSLNFIAVELENPFGTDANDLPMSHFQEEMNTCLMMLLHENTDMISGTSPNCLRDFHQVEKTIKRHKGFDDAHRLSAWFPRLGSLVEVENSLSFSNAISHRRSSANNPQEPPPVLPTHQRTDRKKPTMPKLAALAPQAEKEPEPEQKPPEAPAPEPPPQPPKAPEPPPPAPAQAPPAPAALPAQLEPVSIDQGTEEVIKALDRWSKLAKAQAAQLDEGFAELKKLGDTLPMLMVNSAMDAAGMPHTPGRQWESAFSPV